MDTVPAIDYEGRRRRLTALADIHQDEAMFVSSLPNVRYLSGFTGTAGILLLLRDSAILVADGRYAESASVETEAAGVEVVSSTESGLYNTIAQQLRGVHTLIIDPQQVTIDVYTKLGDALAGTAFSKVQGLPEKIRLVKDESEILRIRQAARVALIAFYDVAPLLLNEPRENEFAALLESRIRALGADDIAFRAIVASGPNSSKPHARPTERVIRANEPVVIDFGAVVDGYHSDITRTLWVGELGDPARRVYEAAKEAQTAGLGILKPGVSHAAVDRACRMVLSRHGFVENPLHPSGHSLGLSIHERPFLSPYSLDAIDEGYVLTVEPGLYIRGTVGARIEDTVVVRGDGVEILSAPANLRLPSGIYGLQML